MKYATNVTANIVKSLPFGAQLETFIGLINEKKAKNYADMGLTYNDPDIVAVENIGARYIKLASAEKTPFKTGPYVTRSVYCFVDINDGDLIKGSWKAPVKNGVRGNLLKDSMDVLMTKFNHYGPNYLR